MSNLQKLLHEQRELNRKIAAAKKHKPSRKERLISGARTVKSVLDRAALRW